MKYVCVYCGSSPGKRPSYLAAAREFGAALAKRDIGLVYGGASVGIMGAVADGALQAGGRVIGVIPRALVERELAHAGLTELRITESMHERKLQMSELADAFVALPGGVGTLEELFEIWTWAQLGLHRKACALLDVDGYYRGLAQFLDHTVSEGFIQPRYRSMLLIADSTDALLEQLASYVPPQIEKWMRHSQT